MILDEYQNSLSDEQFLSFQDNDWGILMYATCDNYEKLFIGSNHSNRLMRRHPLLRNFVQYLEANYFNGQFTQDL